MAPALIVENELYAEWRRRDRRSLYVERGDTADDDPEDPTEYLVQGRVDPDDAFVTLDGGLDIQDFETWVGLSGLAYKPTWVQAVDLDSGDYLYINDANQTGLDLPGPFTIECWVYFDSVPASGEIWSLVNKGATSGPYQYILSAFRGTDAAIGLSLAVDDYAQERGVDPAGLVANTWYHIAAVYDPDEAAANDKIKFYVDAVESANFNTGSGGSLPADAEPFSVGGSGNTFGFSFKGRIQDVRIWSVVKSSTFILNNRFVWRKPEELANLVAWWPLNGDADDGTDAGNDLADTGSPTYTTGAPGLSPNGAIRVVAEYTTKTLTSLQAPQIEMALFRGRNLVRNPSFERDAEEWTTLTGTPGFNAVGAYGGRSMGGNGNGSGNTQENEQIDEVTALALSALAARYVRTSYLRRKATLGTADTVQVKVRTYDSTPTLLDTYDSGAVTPASDASWERVVNMMAANANTDSVKVTNKLVEISGGGGLEPNVYLDELDVRAADTYDCFHGGPAAACLSNPDFNTNDTGWNEPSGTWTRGTVAPLHEGSGYYRCQADGEANQTGTLPAGYNDEGDTVVLFCARYDDSAGEAMNVILELLDSADAVLASEETTLESVGTTWTRRRLYLDIPNPFKLGGDGNVKVKIRFVGDRTTGNSRVDDLECFVVKGRA